VSDEQHKAIMNKQQAASFAFSLRTSAFFAV
jgi:hypothetical protein